MTRSEELDRMSEEDKQADILKNLKACDFIRLYNRQQVQFWEGAASALAEKGLVTFKFREIDDQESCYEIRKVKQP